MIEESTSRKFMTDAENFTKFSRDERRIKKIFPMCQQKPFPERIL